MGISSSSWLSLVAKNQGSSSGTVLVRLKHAEVEETHLLLHLSSCQFWHSSPVALTGAGP